MTGNEPKKNYKSYQEPSVIISTQEEFETFKSHKLKKVWYNDRKKRCLESFLYLYDVKKEGEPDKYVAVPIVKGVTVQEEMFTGLTADLFKPDVIVFAGFIENQVLDDTIKLRMQGGF